MSEATDGLRAVGIVRQWDRQERRRTAADQFRECQTFAEKHGMTLKRCSESHYQLWHVRKLWNIYPGNCRLMGVLETGTPFIENLKYDWTLRDVVEAVATTLKLWGTASDHAKAISSTSFADPTKENSGLA
jgi:hypothetical protein